MPTEIDFGVVLELNNQIVALKPNKVKPSPDTKVIDVGLPLGTKIDLGPVGLGINDIIKTITGEEFDLQARLNTFPGEIQNIAEAVLSAHLSIEHLHLRLVKPASGDGTQTVTKHFTVGLSLAWTDEHKPHFGVVQLNGIYLNISNEQQ